MTGHFGWRVKECFDRYEPQLYLPTYGFKINNIHLSRCSPYAIPQLVLTVTL